MEEKQGSRYKWIILALVWLAVFASAYAQYQLPAIAGRVIQDLGISTSQFASLVSAPMWVAIFGSLFAGAISDKFGVKRVITVGFVISAIGLFIRISASDYTTFFFSMVALGAVPSFLTPNRAKVLRQWFGREDLSIAMGIALTTSALGTSIATATTALFPTINSAYTFAFAVLVVIGIFWVVFMKDKPKDVIKEESDNEKEKKDDKSIWSYLVIALKSKNVWKTGLALLMAMTFMQTFKIFFPMVLRNARGFDEVAAGLYSSPIAIGTLFGTLISPMIYKAIGRYKPCLMGIAIVGAVVAFFSWQVPEGIAMIIMTFLTGLAMGAPMPLLMTYPVLLPEIGEENAATAGGLVATIQLLGPVLVIPYIIAPIAGENAYVLLGLPALAILLMGITSLILPELGEKAKGQTSENV